MSYVKLLDKTVYFDEIQVKYTILASAVFSDWLLLKDLEAVLFHIKRNTKDLNFMAPETNFIVLCFFHYFFLLSF